MGVAIRDTVAYARACPTSRATTATIRTIRIRRRTASASRCTVHDRRCRARPARSRSSWTSTRGSVHRVRPVPGPERQQLRRERRRLGNEGAYVRESGGERPRRASSCSTRAAPCGSTSRWTTLEPRGRVLPSGYASLGVTGGDGGVNVATLTARWRGSSVTARWRRNLNRNIWGLLQHERACRHSGTGERERARRLATDVGHDGQLHADA